MKLNNYKFKECCFKTLPKEGRKLVWELTHKCNFRCSYCYQTRKRIENPMRVLHPTDLRIAISKFQELNVKDVLLTGGEIFFVKDALLETCKELRKLNITFSFSTNYIYYVKFIDYLINLAPRALNLSFDPKTTETEKYYKHTIKALENILTKCQTNNIYVKATAVITRQSLINLQKYIDSLSTLCEKYSCLASIYLTNPYQIGYLINDIRAKDADIRGKFRPLKISPFLKKRIQFINYHRLNAPLQFCHAGTHLFHIEPNGDIYPCHLFANLPKETFLMGNIVNEAASELENRLSYFGKQTKDAIRYYKEQSKACEKCSSEKKCGGGCIAEIVSVGQLIEPQLICKYIKPAEIIRRYKPSSQQPLEFSSVNGDLTEDEEKAIVEQIKLNIRKGHDLAHGLDHILCVVRYARYIAKKEKANIRIVTAAAYFHDFEPRKKLIYESHSQVSAEKAVNFLKDLEFYESELSGIYHCIDTSSYGSHELGHKPLSLEAKCVRDADWLDAIGARGIARVFAFASAHGCAELGKVEWSIDKPPQKRMSLIGPDPSPIYHFFSKLLWVKNEMQTKTGRKLAAKRHQRLIRFLREYRKEMDLEG